MALDCPVAKENKELKAEVEQLRAKLQEVIDETRSRLIEKDTDTAD